MKPERYIDIVFHPGGDPGPHPGGMSHIEDDGGTVIIGKWVWTGDSLLPVYRIPMDMLTEPEEEKA